MPLQRLAGRGPVSNMRIAAIKDADGYELAVWSKV